MLDVVPIIAPRIDWPALTELAQSSLGRSITTMADRNGLKANSPAAQIVVLESFSTGDGQSARKMLQDAWASTLGHLHFGFWINCDPQATEAFILASGGLLSISGRDAIIASGSLLQWRDAIRAGLSIKANSWARMIFAEIYNKFGLMELQPVFGVKKSNSDGSFLLE